MKFGLNSGVIKGSLLLLIAFNIYHVLNFVFQAIMVRLLGLADFSIYGPLSALIYLLAVITESSQTVIAKYSSIHREDGHLLNILRRAIKRSLSAALLLFAAYLVFSFPLSSLLRISWPLVLLTGLMIFTSFLIPIGRGALQGRERFLSLGFNTVGEALMKIGLGVFFVLLGWKVYGVMAAIVVSVLVSFILSLVSLRKIFGSKEKRIELPRLYSYSFPTFAILLGITSFYVIDLIIARAVFPDETAGIYAVIALLGKAIFWGTQPISKALFPISAKKPDDVKKKNELGTALVLLIFCIVVALTIFFIFPNILIKIFSGTDIGFEHNILFVIGLAFSFVSVANLLALHKLSIGRTKRFWLIPSMLVVEIIVLLSLHSNLIEFSYGLLVSSIMVLLASILSLGK